MLNQEHLYAIALRQCNGVGNAIFKKLVAEFGSAQEVWNTPKKMLLAVDGLAHRLGGYNPDEALLSFAEKELEFCEKNHIKVNLYHLGDLPFRLQGCDDAPAILYQKGEIPENKKPISIVGTRNMTTYGKAFIENFLSKLQDFGVMTISGLALGVDAEVHQRSLDFDIPTVGVLAHGFHLLYPTKNRILSEKMLENGGALLTEYNTTHKPDREHFIQRNRIVAGLSPAIIVVETAFGGGSISTVGFANGYNRDVYALPGKITDKYSQGCNLIISQHKAATIATISDLIVQLGLESPKEKTGSLFPEAEVSLQLSPEHKAICEVIFHHPQISLDDLAEKLSLPSYQLLPILLEMEILGVIRSFSGRQFELK